MKTYKPYVRAFKPKETFTEKVMSNRKKFLTKQQEKIEAVKKQISNIVSNKKAVKHLHEMIDDIGHGVEEGVTSKTVDGDPSQGEKLGTKAKDYGAVSSFKHNDRKIDDYEYMNYAGDKPVGTSYKKESWEEGLIENHVSGSHFNVDDYDTQMAEPDEDVGEDIGDEDDMEPAGPADDYSGEAPSDHEDEESDEDEDEDESEEEDISGEISEEDVVEYLKGLSDEDRKEVMDKVDSEDEDEESDEDESEEKDEEEESDEDEEEDEDEDKSEKSDKEEEKESAY